MKKIIRKYLKQYPKLTDFELGLCMRVDGHKKVTMAMISQERWSCGKCYQIKNNLKGEPIPEHFRTCPKRGMTD